MSNCNCSSDCNECVDCINYMGGYRTAGGKWICCDFERKGDVCDFLTTECTRGVVGGNPASCRKRNCINNRCCTEGRTAAECAQESNWDGCWGAGGFGSPVLPTDEIVCCFDVCFDRSSCDSS